MRFELADCLQTGKPHSVQAMFERYGLAEPLEKSDLLKSVLGDLEAF